MVFHDFSARCRRVVQHIDSGLLGWINRPSFRKEKERHELAVLLFFLYISLLKHPNGQPQRHDAIENGVDEHGSTRRRSRTENAL